MAALYDDGLEKHATQFIKLLSIWFWTKMVAWATNQIRNLHNNTSLKKNAYAKIQIFEERKKSHAHTHVHRDRELSLSALKYRTHHLHVCDVLLPPEVFLHLWAECGQQVVRVHHNMDKRINRTCKW